LNLARPFKAGTYVTSKTSSRQTAEESTQSSLTRRDWLDLFNPGLKRPG
jgi:hypothetical protein